MRKLTKPIINKLVKKIGHGNYKIEWHNKPYEGAHQKLNFIHLKPQGHNCHFQKSWNAFKNRPRCPNLYKKANIGRHRKWNRKNIARYIRTKTHGEYKLLTKKQITSEKQTIKILHCKPYGCGRSFKMTFDKFKNSHERCPYDRFNLTKAQVNNRIKRWSHGTCELALRGPYQNYNQVLPILCLKKYHIFHVTLNQFRKDPQCTKCSKNPHRKFTVQTLAKRINKLGGGHYKLMPIKGTFNLKKPVPIKHDKCGKVSYMLWQAFRDGERCQHCNYVSRGEETTAHWLEQHHTKFIHGYLTTCFMSKRSKKLNKPLHLDFYLPDTHTGIEYDGVQHFEILKHFGGKRGHKEQQKRDRKKNNWCRKHHIKLIRIISLPTKNYRKQNRKFTVAQLNKSVLPIIK